MSHPHAATRFERFRWTLLGMEQTAADQGLVGLFATITPPSVPMPPALADMALEAEWRQARIMMSRAGLSVYGCSIRETYARCGTPHRNLMLWITPEKVEQVQLLLADAFCDAQIDRIKAFAFTPASEVARYVAKYFQACLHLGDAEVMPRARLVQL
ncbi:replication endonuclease [Chitinolyticbacter meiyuanensis]|uniref:replication endonuclease n=1 Tax=Chitinolyticbacter meiyuanensis TaxID=682798 RepID=UPI0011E5C18D|nr:replication endonuclease [Chitinolyticbacter meiyuanensis]